MSHFVIIGAGQAGAALAAKLRTAGHEGAITLIGDEPSLPYQRPPLSKKYLMQEMTLEQLHLRPARFYEEQGITLLTGCKVTSIDRAARAIRLENGESLAYDQLALTTGAAPRRLPAAMGGDLARVYTVRDLADVAKMAPEFRPGRHVLVLGGGYIGLEAAAVAAKLGLKVTLLEAAPRILQRVAAPETSDFFRALHRENGVTLIEGCALETLRERPEGGIEAQLADGRSIAVDFVVSGIGVGANDQLAAAAGLECANGIVVDTRGQSSDPAIWAAGDCAVLPYRDAMIRLESVQNAIDQAEAVAANMLGAAEDYIPKPWFWSDQYALKLQIAGLNTGYDRVVVRKAEGQAACSHWYFKGETLLAVDAMNDPRNYMIGKRLIEAGRSPDAARIADPASDLKALL